jgi:hypothetical protein
MDEGVVSSLSGLRRSADALADLDPQAARRYRPEADTCAIEAPLGHGKRTGPQSPGSDQ